MTSRTEALDRRIFDVNSIPNEPEPELIPELKRLASGASPENEMGSFIALSRSSTDRILVTFVEIDGYPILRVSVGDQSQDLILNNDQVKLLLRQMTLWLTK